ncbi:hypothetical protein [Rhizobium leguminosarum]|uniref:hypothetical protein n=1 Tax=Rhizobium leguminosarum TaxID=384 RepID=UPI0010313D70|nr:hypothetical protein [Rhizobium leguminosarum]TAY88106.1 hypothetical protein ELH83_09900 [Rhizobium leguminosarum]
MTVTTWAEAKAKMSVGVNGAFIPFERAPDAMQRFVRPALFSTGDDTWELRTFGTALLCKYRDLYLAVATAHQTGDGGDKPAAEKFVVLAADGERTLAIPPKTVRWPRIGEEQYVSLQDLCVFDFGERAREHRFGTLDLKSIKWSDDAGLTVDYSFLIGYPTASSDAEINEEGAFQRFVNKWIRQDLQPDAPKLMDVENRSMFVKHVRSTRSSVVPDGLSGSPVFSIVRDAASDRYLRFDGIVTDAHADRFAVYPSVHIRDFLDVIVAETPGESEPTAAAQEN